MKEIKVKMTFFEEVLAMSPSNEDIYRDYIASKAPDAAKIEEEVEAIGVEGVIEKSMTVFPRTDDGKPFIWDYQIKGMFKDTCGGLRRIKGTKSSKLTSYKKIIDKTIFPEPRKILIDYSGEIGNCQRPLRAATPQGERVSLASSETVPAGSSITFSVLLFDDDHEDLIREWLDYGKYGGFGQWRNSGKGRYTYDILPD